MSHKELLEKAAKAAGIVFDKSPYNGGPKSNPGFTLDGNPVLDWHNFVIWNPLTDDGDALRLAVKLKMRQCADEVWVIENTSIGEYEADPYAATRRAIVLAAAEIGSMK